MDSPVLICYPSTITGFIRLLRGLQRAHPYKAILEYLLGALQPLRFPLVALFTGLYKGLPCGSA